MKQKPERWQNVTGAIPPDWVQGRGTGNSGQTLILITDHGLEIVGPGEWLIRTEEGLCRVVDAHVGSLLDSMSKPTGVN